MIGDVELFFGADSIPDDFGKDFILVPDDGISEDDCSDGITIDEIIGQLLAGGTGNLIFSDDESD